jgi:hypothetical protein
VPTALLAGRATPSVSLYLPTGHLAQDAAAILRYPA